MTPLPSDLELAEAAAATYLDGAVPSVMVDKGAIRIFVSQAEGGCTIITTEGTHDPIGWALDFFALDLPAHGGVSHEFLGWVHAGFYAAALQVYGKVKEIAQKGPFAINGHSLGAAEALMLGALLIADGIKPLCIGAFAPPRSGDDRFVKLASSVPVRSFRFGVDVVPTVPFRILPLYPYSQVPLTPLGATSKLGRFGAHHISNYVAGIKELSGAGT